MPTYEYKCEKCGVFEISQRITEDALRTCPTCNGGVERLISASAFHLKGGGWYKTDYAAGPSATGSGSAGAAPAETSSSTETKSEPAKTEVAAPAASPAPTPTTSGES